MYRPPPRQQEERRLSFGLSTRVSRARSTIRSIPENFTPLSANNRINLVPVGSRGFRFENPVNDVSTCLSFEPYRATNFESLDLLSHFGQENDDFYRQFGTVQVWEGRSAVLSDLTGRLIMSVEAWPNGSISRHHYNSHVNLDLLNRDLGRGNFNPDFPKSFYTFGRLQ